MHPAGYWVTQYNRTKSIVSHMDTMNVPSTTESCVAMGLPGMLEVTSKVFFHAFHRNYICKISMDAQKTKVPQPTNKYTH